MNIVGIVICMMHAWKRKYYLAVLFANYLWRDLSVQQAINSWWEGFRGWQIPWQKYDVLLSMQSNAQMLNGINLGALYKTGCSMGLLGVIACLLLVE